MVTDLPKLQPEQLNLAKLPAGDSATWTCCYCHLLTQGGHAGLHAHIVTVHPERAGPS